MEINTNEFQGFFELTSCVASLIEQEESYLPDQTEQIDDRQIDDSNPFAVDDDLKPEPIENTNKYLERTESYNPFLDLDAGDETNDNDDTNPFGNDTNEDNNDAFYSALF